MTCYGRGGGEANFLAGVPEISPTPSQVSSLVLPLLGVLLHFLLPSLHSLICCSAPCSTTELPSLPHAPHTGCLCYRLTPMLWDHLRLQALLCGEGMAHAGLSVSKAAITLPLHDEAKDLQAGCLAFDCVGAMAVVNE